MINSLRKKFLIITMSSVLAVLSVIIGLINIMNYRSIIENADSILELLAGNNGIFPQQEDMRRDRPDMRDMSPEVPFETRYFTVWLNSDNNVTAVDTGKIAAIPTGTAAQYAAELAEAGKVRGFIRCYRYLAVSNNDNIMYIFVDCNKDLSTFFSFMTASILISATGILLVFIMVLFLSRMAVKPIAESYEKQKRFITDASHEIKTPLAIINANTEVLELESGQNEWTESIKKQIKGLNSLVEKMVFLARMDEEKDILKMAEFPLSDVVLETVRSFEAVAVAEHKELRTDIERNISYNGDEDGIRQVVSLLLDNAIKYSDDNSIIEITLKASGKTRVLTVSNAAEGIEKGNLDVSFERFYRSDVSRNSRTGGHGIGLSVAKAVVTAHKGKISARSEDGKTVIFTVKL